MYAFLQVPLLEEKQLLNLIQIHSTPYKMLYLISPVQFLSFLYIVTELLLTELVY